MQKAFQLLPLQLQQISPIKQKGSKEELVVTFQESLNLLWDHDTCHLLYTAAKPAATAPVPQRQGQSKEGSREGGDTQKKVGGTTGLHSDAQMPPPGTAPASSTYLLTSSQDAHVPWPPSTSTLWGTSAPANELQKCPTPATAQLNLCSCISILIWWHLGVHLPCYHTTQHTCCQSRGPVAIDLTSCACSQHNRSRGLELFQAKADSLL